MSRRARAEGAFGSDSFLDIVCNVVGILIILMVVAGVRASRAPVVLPTMNIEPVPQADALAPEPDDPPLPLLFAAEEPEEPAPLALPELPPVLPPSELVAEVERLRRELSAIEAAAASSQGRMAAARRQEQQARERLDALNQQLANQSVAIDQAMSRRAATQQELEQLRRLMQELAQAVRQQAASTPAGKKLEHRISPIGQMVTGKEVHFRVLNNRVSVVPLEALIERVKSQIERHKDWLARSRQQIGQVGPIEGYTMHYVVERETGSVVDELRMGPGVFRISVSQWNLEVDRQAPSESVAEALQPGSRFLTALNSADTSSALTFWVYPDSFSSYVELKSYCQQLNFLIAARPLPEGIPIAGSPTGSRSTGQ